ncbi:DUF397 domain-containing protein [Streptomyces sp. NPDC099050]|uniref:DUF397 domain-containing protein n=1 Tax=Streptomyces sp. NPDC099050 TaxID=3366100 RepID=UPI0038140E85
MPNSNLYEKAIEGPFIALCSGGDNGSDSMESCITVSDLVGGGYALRDSKPEGQGQELRMSRAEITGFAREWLAKNG